MRHQATASRSLPLSLGLLVFLIAHPSPARADLEGVYAILAVDISLSAVGAAGGLVAAIGNGVIAGKGERPSLSWRIMGYVCGGLNVSLAVFNLLAGSRGDALFLGVGGGQLGLGLLDIGLSVWAGTRPARPARLSLGPRLLIADQARLAFGVGLTATGW